MTECGWPRTRSRADVMQRSNAATHIRMTKPLGPDRQRTAVAQP